jgi:hypothetical protein
MGLRGWVRRLEHAARGNLESFVLEDSTRHFYDPETGEVLVKQILYGFRPDITVVECCQASYCTPRRAKMSEDIRSE